MSEFINEWFIHASIPLLLVYYFTTIVFWVAVALYKEAKSGWVRQYDYVTECTLTVMVLFAPQVGWLLAALWYS